MVVSPKAGCRLTVGEEKCPAAMREWLVELFGTSEFMIYRAEHGIRKIQMAEILVSK